jgi:AcrR family transcriptional regulator
MEELYVSSDVRERLLLAGIAELEENGIKGFSLRKAALSAQVSCAAPYRHFKDKEEFIVEIIKYIASKWELMCAQITSVFCDDVRRLVIELAVANLRFWLSNPKFRSVLMLILESDNNENSHFDLFDTSLLSAIEDYAEKCGGGVNSEMKKYTVKALIYGSLMSKNDAPVVDFFRQKMEEEFPQI